MLTNEKVLQRLTERFGDKVLDARVQYGMMSVTLDVSVLMEAMRLLKEDEALQFTFLTDLCGVHWPDREKKFEVVYHLHNLRSNLRLRIKTPLAGDPPRCPSLTPLWSAANWMERETYDFYGIIFEGHPNLKRILNVDEMTIFPMRKEYPLEDNTRKDKNDEMFGRDPALIRADL
ncbi:MAG: NADH-quinone oxidoreductase subunit C [Chitinophagales bacterium]|nr:NADH-quinone oxidoreductase subunit C [Chitinophagales bacterium]MDW8428225.1 NADH-quinone oxidoreductase subunit C [Chitinophagales bacterium]